MEEIIQTINESMTWPIMNLTASFIPFVAILTARVLTNITVVEKVQYVLHFSVILVLLLMSAFASQKVSDTLFSWLKVELI